MPPSLWPADGVFLAWIETDVVILRVPADAYECLLGAASDISSRPDGSLAVADPDLAEALVEAGVAVRCRPAMPRRFPTRPRGELALDISSPSGATLRSALGMAWDTLVFRGKPLGALARDAGVRLRHPPADPASRLHASAAAFQQALPWMPFQGECLQRAFQLKRALARRGILCDWIFGVRTWPFGAHCWIQTDDLVVGDTLAHVSAYTPIMVA